MTCVRRGREEGRRLAIVLLASTLVASGCRDAPAPSASLTLSIVDAATGSPTPARVELLDDTGRALQPENAMPIVRPECFDTAIPAWLRGPREAAGLDDPYTGTAQFYADGSLETTLPAGTYRARAFKGTEYEIASGEVSLAPGGRHALTLSLRRWVDLPAEGWWAADDHLHISRRGPEDDAPIARWMDAEGIHVANLLQGGNASSFDIASQYEFGDEGAYRGDTVLLISGQEHPRTHVLGHTMILGGEHPIDLRDRYLVYERFFAEAARQGALSGYAHWGLGGGTNGLAIDAPTRLLSFVEVLDFDYAYYDLWYDLLAMGLRITPTGGTDYPCNPMTIPGRDRFYVRVDGPPTRATWLQAVEAGRTFVTNGPAIEIDVAGVGPGGELALAAPADAMVRARTRFDPARDDVRRLELVRGGEVIASASTRNAPGEIVLEERLHIDRSTWLAARATGGKLGETVPPGRSPSTLLVAWLLPKVQGGAPFAERFMRSEARWPSNAHTAAVYVDVAGTPPLDAQPAARETARRWAETLRRLRARLDPDRIGDVPIWSVATGDGASLEVLERDRDALVRAIDRSTDFYERLQGPPPTRGN